MAILRTGLTTGADLDGRGGSVDNPRMDAREQMIHLLRLNAWLAIQDGNPELVPTIRDGVAAGKAQADILKECAAIEPDEDVLDGAQAAIEYLQMTPLEEQQATENAIQAKQQMLADPAMKERLFQAKLARLRQLEEQAEKGE